MADGNGAPVGIEAIIGDVETVQMIRELPEHTERLRGERFVDLPDVDVLRTQMCPLERRGDRLGRSDAHVQRVQGIGRRRHHPCQGLDAEGLGLFATSDDDGARTVAQAG